MDLLVIKEEITDDTMDDNNDNNSGNKDMKSKPILTENEIKIEDNLSESNININTNTNQSNSRLRRGRKNRRIGGKVDMRAKLERSRQSARECRARKKLRYQYLEDLVVKRELANIALKEELQMYRQICKKIDSGHKPQDVMVRAIEEEKQRKNNRRA